MLVTAPANVGKSRLAYEIVRRVRQRNEPVAVWIGRGDPLRRGAAFGMLRTAIQSACGIRDGEPIEVRSEELRTLGAERMRAHDAQRMVEFLDELLSMPFADEDSVLLRVARDDARVSGNQMRRARRDRVSASSTASLPAWTNRLPSSTTLCRPRSRGKHAYKAQTLTGCRPAEGRQLNGAEDERKDRLRACVMSAPVLVRPGTCQKKYSISTPGGRDEKAIGEAGLEGD
ncbi:hypothetical protein [Sorangium sp. So ce887]|uniref:hypothetical protein n=1 Tax=Sorangium sp. So ce887 TaxID=3133324 RepID=UPI003F60E682